MNAYIRAEYMRLRHKGWGFREALRAARIQDAWTDLENEGVVRIEHPVDCEPYDDSYIDTWDDLSPKKREEEKKRLWRQIERQGVYGIQGQFSDGEHWNNVDTMWGIFGDDLTDNGYDLDIKEATIAAYRRHCNARATSQAAELAERVTYASV